MVDILLLHELRKFLLMLIPLYLLDTLSPVIGALVVTLVPYTPFEVILFVLIFLAVYSTDLFGWSSSQVSSCRYNKLEQKSQFSMWATVKSTYMIYFIVAFIINYNSIFNYQIIAPTATTIAVPAISRK